MRLKASRAAKDVLVKRLLRPEPAPWLRDGDGRGQLRGLYWIPPHAGIAKAYASEEGFCGSTSIAPNAGLTSTFRHQHSLHTSKNNGIVSTDKGSYVHAIKHSMQFLPSIVDQQLREFSGSGGRVRWMYPRLSLPIQIEHLTSFVKPPLAGRMMSVGSEVSTGSGSIPSSVRQFFSPIWKQINGIKGFASGHREAAGIHLEAFWKQNYWLLVGAAGVAVCLLLWRIMFGIASVFVGFSEGMAEFGFLALAAAVVIFGIVLRARYSINPDAVYKIAMRKLNSTAGVLEVMGPPMSGTDVRAYVMSGGGFQLKNFRLRLSRERCFLMFPLQGAERRALVSCEVIKNKGHYDFKLLALDLPTAEAVDQRLFVVGDEHEYKVAGGLISELRDPIIKALAAQAEFDAQDEKEAEAEAAQAKAQAEAEAVAEAAQAKAEAEARVAKAKAKAEAEAGPNS
ncbi:hypothetical protein O6H91_07G024300 [Diphasiastrum complanatum]|uniref:Uncharacterized protein n=1 Tax=Diphasiastrum complanatum TaxID=34168 RepID=A0ACC2D388_DIPCM|nr:hypothetical protein O6H91_07G024300 [Diphasiastrum complanatum]